MRKLKVTCSRQALHTHTHTHVHTYKHTNSKSIYRRVSKRVESHDTLFRIALVDKIRRKDVIKEFSRKKLEAKNP